MSKQFVLNTVCLIILGFFIGYASVYVFLKPSPMLQLAQKRDPSSLNVYQNQPQFKLGTEALLYSYIDVRIKHESIAEKKDDYSVVKALVTAKKDIPHSMSYSWILGEDVVSQDSLIGSIPALKGGESHEVEFRVLGFSKEFQSYLSLTIDTQIENQIVRKDYLSTSRPEDSFEYLVQRNNQIEKSQLEKTKGVNKMGSNQKTALEKKFNPSEIIK